MTLDAAAIESLEAASPMPTYAQRRAISLALPPTDLRPLLSAAARDQGPRPLCVPFAIAGVHEAARTLSGTAAVEPLSVEPLWGHCLGAGKGGRGGTTLQAGADALSAVGHPLERDWPYDPSLGPGTEAEPPTAAGVSWFDASALLLPLAHDGIEDLVDQSLAVGLAVVLVVELTDEFDDAAADGEIKVPPLAAAVGDYHAVVALGAATNAAGTARRLLVRNSWGAGWGAGGYGWLPLDYLVAFAVQAAVIDPVTLAQR